MQWLAPLNSIHGDVEQELVRGALGYARRQGLRPYDGHGGRTRSPSLQRSSRSPPDLQCLATVFRSMP